MNRWTVRIVDGTIINTTELQVSRNGSHNDGQGIFPALCIILTRDSANLENKIRRLHHSLFRADMGKKNYFKEGQKHLGWAFRLSSPRAATLLLFSFPQQSTCEKTECKAILAVQNMCSQFLFCASSCFTTPPP